MKTPEEQKNDRDKILGKYKPSQEERDKTDLDRLRREEAAREERRRELWEGVK